MADEKTGQEGPLQIAADNPGGLELVCYRTSDHPNYAIVPGTSRRNWIDQSPERFAARCLPLMMANQAGWYILNPEPFRALWLGGDAPDRVVVEALPDADDEPPAEAHFGVGVLTFTFPWLFRTPPGWNLLARGPANWPKDSILALEGLVETDWAPMTFTMNWKFTAENVWVTFEAGDPICQIVPVRRHDLELFQPVEKPLASDPQLDHDYNDWSEARDKFNASLKTDRPMSEQDSWQKHYMRGLTYGGVKAPEHQTKLRLKELVEEE